MRKPRCKLRRRRRRKEKTITIFMNGHHFSLLHNLGGREREREEKRISFLCTFKREKSQVVKNPLSHITLLTFFPAARRRHQSDLVTESVSVSVVARLRDQWGRLVCVFTAFSLSLFTTAKAEMKSKGKREGKLFCPIVVERRKLVLVFPAEKWQMRRRTSREYFLHFFHLPQNFYANFSVDIY